MAEGLSLAELLGAHAGIPERKPLTLTTPEVINKLVSACMDLTTPHEFVPGMIVRHKKAVFNTRSDPPGGIYVYIRDINADELPTKLATRGAGDPGDLFFVDCLLGQLDPRDPDGGGMALYLHSKEMLEPYPETRQ